MLLIANSCTPPTANYLLFFFVFLNIYLLLSHMIYSFLASFKLYNFQNFINVACPRTPVARILAITLEKKTLSIQNIHQNERRQHDGMWSVRVKKRKGFYLWKGDFPVEEGLSALVYAHYLFTIAEKHNKQLSISAMFFNHFIAVLLLLLLFIIFCYIYYYKLIILF